MENISKKIKGFEIVIGSDTNGSDLLTLDIKLPTGVMTFYRFDNISSIAELSKIFSRISNDIARFKNIKDYNSLRQFYYAHYNQSIPSNITLSDLAQAMAIPVPKDDLTADILRQLSNDDLSDETIIEISEILNERPSS